MRIIRAPRRPVLWSRILCCAVVCGVLLTLLSSCGEVTGGEPEVSSLAHEEPAPKVNTARLRAKALEAKSFIGDHDMSESFCYLADMGLHSGVPRLVKWDFALDTIAGIYMVSHGCCDNPWSADSSRSAPKFSNVDGSHCSSLGRYKIGVRGTSQWGIGVKYILHGLDDTNRNAQRRQIVLHSWDMVPDSTVFPSGAPEGWGCPAVSNTAMKQIDADIRKETDPVLLWIFNQE